MPYRIFLSKQAFKFFEDLNEVLKNRVEELFIVLTEDPLPIDQFDIRKLKGRKRSYRVRIGKLRVIFEILIDKEEINILKIHWRGSVYKDL